VVSDWSVGFSVGFSEWRSRLLRRWLARSTSSGTLRERVEGAYYFSSHPASVALVARNLYQYSHIGELTNGSVRYTLCNKEFTLHERRIDSGMTQYEIHNFPCR
jgi:hypothetical protein